MIMQHGPYVAVIDYEEEEGAFHGRVVNLVRDGFDFWGTNAEELKAALASSAAEYEAFCREQGREPEKPTRGSLDFTKPHTLRNEAEYRLAEERIRVLLRKELEPRSDEWEELLFLAVLVEAYEGKHHPIEPTEVTEENFAALVLQGVKEAAAISRGELKPARVSRSDKLHHAINEGEDARRSMVAFDRWVERLDAEDLLAWLKELAELKDVTAGHKKFSALRAKMSPEAQARSRAKADALKAEEREALEKARQHTAAADAWGKLGGGASDGEGAPNR